MKYSIVFASMLTLAACSNDTRLIPFERAALEQQAKRPVTCKAGKDCEEKWNRAIQWVSQNSAKKIKTLSERMIQTYGVRLDKSRISYPAFTIIKYSTGNGDYTVDYSSACDDVIDCRPSGLELKAAFVYFVMGPPPLSPGNRLRLFTARSISGNIQEIINECRNARITGEIKSYKESVKCSNPRIIAIFRQSDYLYMDLAYAFAARRLALAEMVDRKQITEKEMQDRMSQEIIRMDEEERLRNIRMTQ